MGHSVDLVIAGFEIPSVCVTMFGITIILGVVCYLLTRNMSVRPGKLQCVAEKVVEMLHNFLSGVIGDHLAREFFPVLASLFIVVLMSNYSGLLPMAGHLPGLAAPTSNLSIVAGLALAVFFTTHYAGLKHNGMLGYAKHFVRPMAFMLPLLLLEEIIHPVSLTLRLYGNIMGEESVIAELFNMVPFGVPIVMQALSILMGFIQALVFTLLASIYIMEAAE